MQWFVEPLNPHTNEVIARHIEGDNCMEVEDCEGKKLTVWLADHAFINQLRGFTRGSGVRFNVYSRKKNCGPVKLNNFTDPVKRRKARLVAKAKKAKI